VFPQIYGLNGLKTGMRKRLIFTEAEAQPKKVGLQLPSFLKN